MNGTDLIVYLAQSGQTPRRPKAQGNADQYRREAVRPRVGVRRKGMLTKTDAKKRSKVERIGLKIAQFAITIIPVFLSSAVSAKPITFGVLRSPDNLAQWQDIQTRLQETGTSYCYVNLSNLESEAALPEVNVLLLPSLSNLNKTQVQFLKNWMTQGGQVIVSGATGSTATQEVKEELRSLLGAYWGFPVSNPTTIEPYRLNSADWLQQSSLTGTVSGGVLIPTRQGQTVAVWQKDDAPAAVVTTARSTFLGWHWGNNPNSVAFDVAWLNAALNRYGEVIPAPENFTPTSCPLQQSFVTAAPETPNYAEWTPPTLRRATETVAPVPILAMQDELVNLIGRFESSLLTASVTNSNISLTTTDAVAQFLQNREKRQGNTTSSQTPLIVSDVNNSAQIALVQGKGKLQEFLRLANAQEYEQAKKVWQEAKTLLHQNYPRDSKIHQPEVRAIWLDRGTIVKAKSEADLAPLFDRFAQAGINTVFFETVNASYPIYPSQVAPAQNPLTVGWDPLAAAVKLAHERGMELHAWVWMFAAANVRHNEILNQPRDYLGPVLTANPDWALMNGQQQPLYDSNRKVFLDPASDSVRAYLLSLLNEIATRYPVDGIHLDYIRYPFVSSSNVYYGGASQQKFLAATGINTRTTEARHHNLGLQWTQFKTQQINDFVATAASQLQEKRPDLFLSAAVFPLSRRERLTKIQQNWEEWIQRGDLDGVVLMSYLSDTDELQQTIEPLFSQTLGNSTLVLPGIRLLNMPEAVTLDQLQLLRDLPAVGYSLFAAEFFTPKVQELLQRTQGSLQPTTETIPYRQPFLAASLRYQALQQEWNYLLVHQKLVMDATKMKEWGQQTDTVAQALKILAENPSQSNYLSAKVALSSFRAKFGLWMQLQGQTSPYLVEVWENRLAGLDELLRYGERSLSVNSKQ